MTLTIMRTESHLENVVTSTPNKPATQDSGGNSEKDRLLGCCQAYQSGGMKHFVPASMNACLINVCLCEKTWSEFCIHHNLPLKVEGSR